MITTKYRYTSDDTFAKIAKKFNTSAEVIFKLNGIKKHSCVNVDTGQTITKQIPSKPSKLCTHIQDELNYVLTVPVVGNGGSSEKDAKASKINGDSYTGNKNKRDDLTSMYNYAYTESGMDVNQHKTDCWISVNGTTMNIPCYPESVSDSSSVSYTSPSMVGRTEPYQIYQNSGPRQVSISLTLHREMGGNVDGLVKLIESGLYPTGGSVAASKTCLNIGSSVYVQGIMTACSTNWSGPIIDNKYVLCEVQLTITEVIGSGLTQAVVASKGGYRK